MLVYFTRELSLWQERLTSSQALILEGRRKIENPKKRNKENTHFSPQRNDQKMTKFYVLSETKHKEQAQLLMFFTWSSEDTHTPDKSNKYLVEWSDITTIYQHFPPAPASAVKHCPVLLQWLQQPILQMNSLLQKQHFLYADNITDAYRACGDVRQSLADSLLYSNHKQCR